MHRHVGSCAELIRLAPCNVHDDALAMPRDVRHIERHELGASKRCGKPHGQQRSIARIKQTRQIVAVLRTSKKTSHDGKVFP